MLRRLWIAALPVVALLAVLAVVLGSHAANPRSRASAAGAARAPAGAAARQTDAAAMPARAGAADQGRRLPPAQVRGDAARRLPIPILTYHVVAIRPPGVPNPALWVAPREFAAQMAALQRGGYWAITLERAWRAWTSGGPLPRRPVVLTFDDGYLGDYTNVRPALRRLGWPGVLNLALANVGPRNLKAREVRALVRSGWEIDSHTVNHTDLTRSSDAQLRYELTASRREIERRFASPADFFCYPFGRFDARVEAAVKAAGYRGAMTELEGYATPAQPYALRRVRVSGFDTPATLLTRLRAESPERYPTTAAL